MAPAPTVLITHPSIGDIVFFLQLSFEQQKRTPYLLDIVLKVNDDNRCYFEKKNDGFFSLVSFLDKNT